MPVPKLLRETIRYRVLSPLHYAAGSLRSTFTGRRTTTRRILIASDNLAVTSEEQFAPLLAERNRTFDEIGVLFDHRLLDDVRASRPNPKSYTAVLAKLSFLTPKIEALDKIGRLRRLFPHPVRLIYFDGDDDSCIQWPELVDNVDIYVKKHMFSDPTWYQQQFAGKSNLTDYVSRLHGYSFSPPHNFYNKIRLLSDVTVICEQGWGRSDSSISYQHFAAIDDTVVNHHAIYLQSFYERRLLRLPRAFGQR
jgi:hypothetical protein